MTVKHLPETFVIANTSVFAKQKSQQKTYCYDIQCCRVDDENLISLVSEVPLELFSAYNYSLACACNQPRLDFDKITIGQTFPVLGYGDPIILFNLTLIAKKYIPEHLNKFNLHDNREIWLFITKAGTKVAIDPKVLFHLKNIA